MKSIRATRAELRSRLLSAERYVAAKLEIQGPDGARLFTVGGCWDTTSRRYVDRPCAVRALRLKRSQLQMAMAIKRYLEQRLAGDDARAALLMAIGNRGGGKTFLCGGVLMVVIALVLPGSWQIGVSITAKQNREIKEAIRMVAAPDWISQDIEDFRDQRTEFVTGSTILWLTSKNPKALRQALLPFEHVLINEGQDQREVVFTNSISAIRSGGLVTIATNPPQEGAGDWVAILYQGIEGGSKDGEAYVLDSADNDAVSQPTLAKIERLLRMVNPDAADRDSLGIISLSGTVGYQGFSRQPRREENGRWVSGHVGSPTEPVLDMHGNPIPGTGWIDETRKITAEDSRSESGFDYIAGADFQTDPGCCAAVGKLYRHPSGMLLLWIRELIGSTGTEADLTLALNSRGYFPGPVDHDGKPAVSCVLIGDATGARQNAEHRKRDPYSYTRLRAEGGWTILPPFVMRNQQGGRTPMNPLVEDSRKQMKAVLLSGAIVFGPLCAEPATGFPALIESMARAKVTTSGKFDKKGHHTHGPDGVRYLAWRYLPRNIVPVPSSPPGLNRDTFNALVNARLGWERQ